MLTEFLKIIKGFVPNSLLFSTKNNRQKNDKNSGFPIFILYFLLDCHFKAVQVHRNTTLRSHFKGKPAKMLTKTQLKKHHEMHKIVFYFGFFCKFFMEMELLL